MAGAGRTGGRAVAAWRTAAGVLLAVLAGLAAALTPVVGWGHTLLTDADAFVATYSPVVRSDAVQKVLTTRLSDALIDQLGVDNVLTRRLVTSAVERAVSSEEFASATTAGLRLAHQELLAQLSGEPGRLQVSDGEVVLPFAPFGEALRQRLGAAGVPFVDRLPEVSGGITLFRVDPRLLSSLQLGFRVLDLAAPWLPWVAIGLAVAAVWVWPGVRRPLIGLGLSLLGGVLVVGLAWYLGTHRLWDGLGDDLGLVAGLVASLTTEPVVAPLLGLGVGGALLATLAALSATIVPRRGRYPGPPSA